MSTGDEMTAARTGSGADLARRMDRLEEKYDDVSKDVSELKGAVGVIQKEQEHAEELAKERHGNLESRLATVSAQLSGFMARIEGMLTGEVQLPAQRDALATWNRKADKWDARLDALEDAQAKSSGIWVAIGGVKGAVVAIAAVASPVIVLLGFLLKP